jgi:ribosomal protein RSM22 (predicted rRNA methylase)
MRNLSRKVNVNKKVFTIPVIEDNDLIRYKPLITQKDDLLYGGMTKEEIEEEELEASDDDEIAIGNKASKAILQNARIHQRHIERQPDWFRERVQTICEFRTSNQIQRLLKSWMVKTDVDRLNRYRFSSLGWGPNKIHNVGKEAEDASRRAVAEQKFVYGPDETIVYASYHLPGRFSILQRIFRDIRKFVPNFQPTSMLDFGCGPATGGVAALAAWDFHATKPNSKQEPPIKQYVGVDISQAMIDAAKIMLKDELPNQIFFSRSFDVVQRALKREERYSMVVCAYTLSELPSDAARQAAVQMLYELLNKDGILVIVEQGDACGSHTVRTARHFLHSMTHSLTTRGKFDAHALDEQIPSSASAPSKPNQSSVSNQEMAMMLPLLPGQFRNYSDMGIRTIAPCTHDQVCPLLPGRKCTFMQRVSGSVIRKNAEEKFSYVVMQKVSKYEASAPKVVSTETSNTLNKDNTVKTDQAIDDFVDDRDNSPLSNEAGIESMFHKTPLELMNIITSVGKNAAKWTKRKPSQKSEAKLMTEAEWLIESSQMEKWKSYDPKWNREEWARIVSTPMKNDGHVILDVCMPSGQLRRFTQPRSSLQMLPGLFTAVRKSTLGGLLPIYFSGHERMMSAEENALNAAKDEKRRRGKFVDDEDEDDFPMGEDDEDDYEERNSRKAQHVKRAARKNSHEAGVSLAEHRHATTTNRTANHSVPEDSDEDDGPLDDETKAALEDFKKMFAQQLAGGKVGRPSRARRETSDSFKETTFEDDSVAELMDDKSVQRGNHSRSRIDKDMSEETTDVAVNSDELVSSRRGRRKPRY